MAALSAGLMSAAPVGPGVDVTEISVIADVEEGGDESADFGDGQGDAVWLFAGLLIGAPFAA